MKIRALMVGWLIGMLVGCTPTPEQSPIPAVISSPTPVVDVAMPESVGRAFLEAWQREDYAAMYTFLAPSLQAGLAQPDFELAYRHALATTTTISVVTTPRLLGVEAERAWVDFDVTWETALFGALQASNRLALVQEAGRWWVDWRRETIWPDLAGGAAFAVEYQTPPRANIYDRQGAGLAIASTLVTVGVIPGQIQDETAVLTALSAVLGEPPEELHLAYAGQPATWFIPLGEISGEESLAYANSLNLPGIERRERTGRLYPDGVGAHVVGWISPIPAEQLEDYRRQGYRDDALVGIAGVEAWGEAVLAGKNGGRLSLVDANGAYLRGVAESRPQRGRAIYLTLNRAFQQQVEQILGDRRGAVVALDVHSGAILALVSSPRFDNNIFIRSTDELQRSAVLNDPQRPLLNRATQGVYPCGSVFKVVTIAAGLEAGGLTAGSTFYCPGYWDGLGSANRKVCWRESGHGTITLADALTASCDVTFYEVGRLLDGAGQAVLPTYGRAFGLGVTTGLTEVPEVSGLMPDPDWKLETYQESWTTGDTVNLAIGQGFLLVTPLQVARLMAAVANGGTLYRPYLVDRISTGSNLPEQMTSPQAQGRLPISAEHLAQIQAALLGVTTRSIGTATGRFAGLSVSVAGKTGTAQAPGETAQPHSWFAGYFPADQPEVALVVMVENAGEGSSVAAPLFRQVVEAYYGLPLTPLPEIQAAEGD